MQLALFEIPKPKEKPKPKKDISYYLSNFGYLAGVGIPGYIDSTISKNYNTGESQYTYMMDVEVLHIKNRKAYCRPINKWVKVTECEPSEIFEVDIREIAPSFRDKLPPRIQKKVAAIYTNRVFDLD